MPNSESHVPIEFLRRFGYETMPSSKLERKDRTRSLGSSFEDIVESEDEEEFPKPDRPSTCRSPYALPTSPVVQRRKSSLMFNAIASPRVTRRLMQHNSDEFLRRNQSFSSFTSADHLRSSDSGCELLTLPTIPETSVPVQDHSDDDSLFHNSEEHKEH